MTRPDCEVCRGAATIAEAAWVWAELGLLCPEHADEYRQHLAETTLRSVIPRRQWHARELRPEVAAVDPLGPLGLYLYGEPGRGKSHDEAAYLKRYYVRFIKQHGRPPTVEWWQVLDLLDELRAAQARDRKAATTPLLERLKRCDRLVLDDVGGERPTRWGMERLLGLLSYRYDQCLPTDLSSNYDLGQLANHLIPTDDPEQDPTSAKRIVSRIAEVCVQVHITGEDKRLTMAQQRGGPPSSHTPQP